MIHWHEKATNKRLVIDIILLITNHTMYNCTKLHHKVGVMAAHSDYIQKLIEQEKAKTYGPRSLHELAFGAVFPQLPPRLGFFPPHPSIPDSVCSSINDMLPIWQERLARLLDCAGFGRRQEAETLFKEFPALLKCRGTLTDIAKKTYEDITAFEYVVQVKDAYFARKVVDFLETYQGEDKMELAADLLKQFERSFSEDSLSSVTEFINACKTWFGTYAKQTDEEKERDFVQVVGEAQASFEAHILQEYCHPDRSFIPTPKFNEPDLTEFLSIYNPKSFRRISLLTTSPGVTGNSALLRGNSDEPILGGGGAGWMVAVFVEIDCDAMDALDKARTADLLALRGRLVSIVTPVGSLELHAHTPGC